jgi:DNA gyrase subunit A
MRVFEVPEGTKASKGRAIQNMIQIEPDDKVMAYIPTKDLLNPESVKDNFLILCTKKGLIKKTSLEAYSRPRSNGINAITIVDGDELLAAKLTNGQCEVIMGTREGKAIRFNESTVRPVGRTAQGVKAVNLDQDEFPDNEVIGMVCVADPNSDILVVSEKGMGKRSALEDYRITNRGGKGVKTINVTDKTGKLISISSVDNDHDFMIINRTGITIRLRVEDLRVVGRATQGVKLINLRGNDEIAAVCTVFREEDEVIEPSEDVLPSDTNEEPSDEEEGTSSEPLDEE